jgi:hypothetical protein
MILENNNATYPDDDSDEEHECPNCGLTIVYSYADGDKHCPECGYIAEPLDPRFRIATPTTCGSITAFDNDRLVVWTKLNENEWQNRDGRGFCGRNRVVFAGGDVNAYSDDIAKRE